MLPSQNCTARIKKREGCVLHPYLDSANVPTIGWGSTMYRSGKKVTMHDEPISQAVADDLLQWEINNKAAAVAGALGKTVLNQNQFDALVSLAYNIGVTAFLNSTLLKKVKANPNDQMIRGAFMLWNKITVNGEKIEDKGLTARRKEEAEQYFSTINP